MKANICGGEHEMLMPIGGLEDVARVEPQLQQLVFRLTSGQWTLEELRAVLNIGLKWGKSQLKADDVIEYEGLARCVALAAELMVEAFEVEAEPVGEPETSPN